jgi:hypothetical protein
MNFENFDNDDSIWSSPAFPQKTNPDEDIILLVRQDIAVLIIRLLATLFVFFFLLVIKFIATLVIKNDGEIILKFIDFFVGLGSFILLLAFLRYFHNFYLSLQLVTTDRIIDIDQKGIFRREVNELAINNIEDVTYKQNGLLPTLLGYGEVVIKTSSFEIGSTTDNTVNGFVFENCPEPSKVAGIISDLFHQKRVNDNKKDAITSAEELRKVLQDVGTGNINNTNASTTQDDINLQSSQSDSAIVF